MFFRSTALALLIGTAANAAPVFTQPPTLVPNPNPAVPLAAVLSFAADGPISGDIIVSETLKDSSPRKWVQHFSATDNPANGLALLGFRPGGVAQISVVIRDAKGEALAAPGVLSFVAPSTPPPGLNWPTIKTIVADPAAVEPGVSIISVRRRVPGRQAWQTQANQRFARRWGLLLGFDERGDTVWFYKSDVRIAGAQAQRDGTIMMTLQDNRVRIIDMLGNIRAEYIAELNPDKKAPAGTILIKGVQTMHHEPYMTSDGTMISMSANVREIPNYFTSVTDKAAPRKTQKVMGDSLIEYDRSGNILWQWNSFDYLDPFNVHYHLFQPYWMVRGFPGHLDWTHGNGVTFDEPRDTLVMSFKHLDALVAISHKTGKIKWILGDPANWKGPLAAKVLKPNGEFVRYPQSPHHPHISAPGVIAYYDNGMFQARPFDGKTPVPLDKSFSRGVEVRIDEKAMTFEEIWTSESAQSPQGCYHWAMGEADRLPKTGNMMLVRAFCPPPSPDLNDVDEDDLSKRFVDDVAYYGRVDQYTRSSPARIVSQTSITDANDILQWQLYGGFHVPSLTWANPDSVRDMLLPAR